MHDNCPEHEGTPAGSAVWFSLEAGRRLTHSNNILFLFQFYGPSVNSIEHGLCLVTRYLGRTKLIGKVWGGANRSHDKAKHEREFLQRLGPILKLDLLLLGE